VKLSQVQVVICLLLACLLLAGQALNAQDMGAVRKLSENKFAAVAGVPSCAQVSVQAGDPAKGPSTLLLKGQAGCSIPWHWHTANEQVMVTSGSARVQMKDGPSAVLTAGGYAMMPTKHIHQFTCVHASCMAFVTSDAVFDIHYVDAAGTEIPSEQALKH
jgi:quercetin dioxygenase-like cupin family protein